MGLKLGEKNFAAYKETALPGLHPACLVALWDVGTVTEPKFGRRIEKLYLSFEIHDTLDAEGYPRLLHKDFTASVSRRSSLRINFMKWMGRDFSYDELNRDGGLDLRQYLGQSFGVNVVHRIWNGALHAFIEDFTYYPADLPKLDPARELVYFSFGENSREIPDGCPQWIKEKIMAAPEWEMLPPREGETPPPTREDSPDPQDDEPN